MSDYMLLVDGELEYELPRSKIVSRVPSVKSVDYLYEFTDYNARVRMGRGPTRIVVEGWCTTAELEVLQYATQVDALYTLYWPTEQGGDLDRYYQRVDAMPVQSNDDSASLHHYTIEMHALDGYAYDAATGQKVN